MIKVRKDNLINEEIFDITPVLFADGTPNIRFKFIDKLNLAAPTDWDIIWLFEDMRELFYLKLLTDKFRETSYEYVVRPRLNLIVPYLPGARMDHIRSDDEILVLRSVCDEINSMEFNSVTVYNVHSDVATALLHRVINVSPKDDIQGLAFEYNIDAMFYPDAGAVKRYGDMNLINDEGFVYPFITGEKMREIGTNRITHYDIHSGHDKVKDANILIVDDICGGGWTFKLAAKALKELGAGNIYLFVTHCENIVDLPGLKAAGITRVITTDSICTLEDEMLTIIPKFNPKR